MAELTQDPNCFIEQRGVHDDGAPFVIYQTASGERWRIDGECNQCGLCWEGAVIPPTLIWTGVSVGQPGAIADTRPPEERLDCPVRPDVVDGCVLRGDYL